ncbi:MAG: nuclear transport factor 2 family protein [Pseudonocardiales bacterium]|nr:nuclear transport factor 2 family protein [Pseudonocardiales bacterium]
MDRRTIEQRVRAMYKAFAAGDEDAYRAAFSPDLVWHVPGDSPVSGPTAARRSTSRRCPRGWRRWTSGTSSPPRCWSTSVP